MVILKDISDFVPDDHNKVNTAVRQSHEFVGFSVHIKVVCATLYSIKCIIILCLKMYILGFNLKFFIAKKC